MHPRLVAVDMDGTFLRGDNTYDRGRFERVRERMRTRGVRLVVASGNQYEQLTSFFEEGDVDGFVAENGALVTDGDEQVSVAHLDEADAARAVDVLMATGEDFLASGPDGAFVLETAGDAFVATMAVYYHRLARVPALDARWHRLFKFGTDHPDGPPPGFFDHLTAELEGILTPVTSGHSSIDLIIPGCHKAAGLGLLLDRWGIQPADCAAFGDSGNDLEMLQLVGHPVAMANAADAVLATTPHRAASNNDDGVLAHLERWF